MMKMLTKRSHLRSFPVRHFKIVLLAALVAAELSVMPQHVEEKSWLDNELIINRTFCQKC